MTISRALLAAVVAATLLIVPAALTPAAAVDATHHPANAGPVARLVGSSVMGPSSAASSASFATSSTPSAIVDGFTFGATPGGGPYTPTVTVALQPLEPPPPDTGGEPAGLVGEAVGRFLPPLPGPGSDASAAAQSLPSDAAALFGVEISSSQAGATDRGNIRVGDDPDLAVLSGLLFGTALAGAVAWQQRRQLLSHRH